jgi:hypothetical protein
MLRAIVGRFTTPTSPTNGKHAKVTPGPTAPAVPAWTAATTTIKVATTPEPKVITPTKPKPSVKKAASAPAGPPPKKAGFLDRVMYGA